MIPRTDWEVLVHETISELVSGVTTLSLYGSDHPRAQTSLDRLLANVQHLLQDEDEVPIVLLSGELFVKGRPFTRLSRPAETFVRRMRRRRIEHVTFLAGPEREHLRNFLLDLAKTDDSTMASQPTIRVGSVELSEGESEGPDDKAGGEGRERLSLVRDRVTLVAQALLAVSAGRNLPVGDLDAVARAIDERLAKDPDPLAHLAPWEGDERWPAVHAHNTCVLAMGLAKLARLPLATCVDLGIAALVHDVAKAFLPAELAQREMELGGDELELILDHPRDGLALLLGTGQLPPLALVVCYEHHLQYGGAGYPRLSRPRRPHVATRLVSVADVFSVLHTARGLRGQLTRESTLASLDQWSGGKLDPACCDVLHRLISVCGGAGVPQEPG